MRLGYNTNGLAHHRLLDGIRLLSEVGYESVAITLDAAALDPYDEPAVLGRQIEAVRDLLASTGMSCVVETGARFLLNPRKKHDPTLLDPDCARRAVRRDFLERAIEIASRLDAPVVSLWSGSRPAGASAPVLWKRLYEELVRLADFAAERGVVLGFEPEPGMFIDTMEQFAKLDERVRHPAVHLTLDVGHVHCTEAEPIAAHIGRWGARIVNVHIEDMQVGVHDHLMFGAGTVDFPSVLRALHEIRYGGGLHVELSRHSHAAVEAVEGSYTFLRTRLEELARVERG